MLLFAHVEVVSVSYMRDVFFLLFFLRGGGALMVMPKAYLIGNGASIPIYVKRVGVSCMHDLKKIFKTKIDRVANFLADPPHAYFTLGRFF